ncbi:MAG: histidine--tRNA ligase [Deltaproteobacteria bacterium]|nr:histidine--tRNA ligase [Deltaproteobacteria bacterium]
MIRLIRGFRDILPEHTGLWALVEGVARELLENFGFSEIRLPVLEHTELFARGIGADTDIVEKEMYTFTDRNGDLLTLRPEATAGVVRSYVEHGFCASAPVQKLYTMGPMFRRERPQRGRYRQFYQINAEVLGVQSPLADAQLLVLVHEFFSRLGVTDAAVHVNSLGCPNCRNPYKEELKSYLAAKSGRLCQNCLRRKETNPLRVLDCKSEQCAEAVAGAPSMTDWLCDACRDHFAAVLSAAESQGVALVLDPRLVRGLDYYTRTTFEVRTSALGAQNAVAGGGRYDGLVQLLGGPPRPGIGFAVGVDRLVEILAAQKGYPQKCPDVYFACLGDAAKKAGFSLAAGLARAGVAAEMDFDGAGLKGQMKRAGKSGARFVVILGEDELAGQKAQVRNLKTKEQTEQPMEGLVESLARRVKEEKDNG